MDNFYNNFNNNSFFSGASRLDDQTTDSYQSPDIFLNLEEEKPTTTKIEDNEFASKQEWISPPENMGIQIQQNYESPKFDLITEPKIFQGNNNVQQPMPVQKRSMKIKKEKAKQRAQERQKLLQQQQEQACVKQEQPDSSDNSTNEQTTAEAEASPKQNIGMDQKMDKNMLQKIRNRISAQNSRDRKKKFINELEQRAKNFELQNTELKEKMEQLIKENQQYIQENQILKKELLELKKHYGEETQEDFFSDPQVQQQQRGRNPFSSYGALGLALFSLVSLIMITNINNNDNQKSVNLASIPADTTNLSQQLEQGQQELTNFEKMDEENEEYDNLKEIVESKQLQERQVPVCLEQQSTPQISSTPSRVEKLKQPQQQQFLQIKQEEGEEMTIEDSNKQLVKVTKSDAGKHHSNCDNCSNHIATQQYDQQEGTKVSTIYCPQPYRYIPNLDNSTNSIQEGIKVNIKDQEWIQLFVPKQQMNVFSAEVDNNDNNTIYIQKSKQQQQQQQDKQKIVEVWAKVHSVRDISAKSVNAI